MSAIIADGSDQAYYIADNAAYSPNHCLRVYDTPTTNSSIINQEETFQKEKLHSASRGDTENIKNENPP